MNFFKYFVCCTILGAIFSTFTINGGDTKLAVFVALCCYSILALRYRKVI